MAFLVPLIFLNLTSVVVLRHDCTVRFPRREARRLWQSHRRDAHLAQDRECPDGAEQQTKASSENYRFVCSWAYYD